MGRWRNMVIRMPCVPEQTRLQMAINDNEETIAVYEKRARIFTDKMHTHHESARTYKLEGNHELGRREFNQYKQAKVQERKLQAVITNMRIVSTKLEEKIHNPTSIADTLGNTVFLLGTGPSASDAARMDGIRDDLQDLLANQGEVDDIFAESLDVPDTGEVEEEYDDLGIGYAERRRKAEQAADDYEPADLEANSYAMPSIPTTRETENAF